MSFFRFWNSDPDVFADVLVCPLSTYRRLPLKSLRIYVPRSGRIYLDNMRDTKTFFHEASHHVITLHMPSLYKTARGRAVEETGGRHRHHRCNKKGVSVQRRWVATYRNGTTPKAMQ
jgi:hypothetical protein